MAKSQVLNENIWSYSQSSTTLHQLVYPFTRLPGTEETAHYCSPVRPVLTNATFHVEFCTYGFGAAKSPRKCLGYVREVFEFGPNIIQGYHKK
jgi:hypothetical protein